MKHLCSILFLLLAAFSARAQATFAIKGRVFDQLSGETLPGATVQVSGNGQNTGAGAVADGSYKIPGLPAGTYTVQATFVGYKPLSQQVRVSTQNAMASFGLSADNASLDEVQVVATLAQERQTPVAFAAVNEVRLRETLGNRDLPLILNETPGVYATQSGGGAGDSRISIRGFDQRNVAVLINGVPVNDMENGQVFWSNWDLGDVTKSLQVQRGLSAAKIAVPSVGGTINVLTRGFEDKQRLVARLETGSFNFRKASLMYSSGPLKGDWAFTVFGSRRTSDGWVDMLFDDAWTYFGNISKRVGNHRFSLTGLGSPQRHGQRSFARRVGIYSNEKAQELGATPLKEGDLGFRYNPHWGYLNRYAVDGNYQLVKTGGRGEVLNERTNFYHKPQVNFNHNWTVNERLSVSNVLYASYGSGGGSAGSGGVSVPPLGGQVDFQTVYNRNALNYPKVGNTTNYAGEREASAGFLRNAVNNHRWYGFVSGLDYELPHNLTLSAGIDGRYYHGEHYQEVRDLLGGDYVRNTGNQNADPATRYRVGDKITYNYDGKVQWLGGYGQLEYKTPVLSAVVSGTLSQIGYKRIDYFRKGGVETDYVRITGYSLKAGANYNLTERDNLFVNVGYTARVPFFNFVFDTQSGRKLRNVTTEGVRSLEFGYGISYPSLKATLNGYYTLWSDKSSSSTGFDSGLEKVVYNNVRNIDARHAGVELSVAQEISRRVQLNAAISLGDWRWVGKGLLTQVTEDNEVTRNDVPVFLDGVHVGDAAQNQFQLGLRYEPFQGFYVRPSFLLFTKYYAGFDPISLTQEENRTDSFRVPTSRSLDLHFGYELKPLWQDRVRLGLRGSVLNVLNEFYITDIPARGGVLFTDPSRLEAFFNRGRTFTVGLSATM